MRPFRSNLLPVLGLLVAASCTPVPVPCGAGPACEGGWVCVAGACAKSCASARECPTPATDRCLQGLCVPGGCDGSGVGASQERVRFEVATVPYGELCHSQTQRRTCEVAGWSAWSGTFAEASCVGLARQDCGLVPDGTAEIRRCYAAASVPDGATCAYAEQIRVCRAGKFERDWPNCENPTCVVAGHPSCEGTPHGDTQTRRCFLADLIPAGSTCQEILQARTCSDGAWNPDWPPCAHPTCAVQGHQSCAGTPHGSSQVRQCYAAASVPYGSSCVAAEQRRTCDDGAWKPDFPACAALDCVVEPPPNGCGATPHGGSQTRPCYDAASVPHDQPCTYTLQTRTCVAGAWSPDWPGCAALACAPLPGASCGATPDGGGQSRYCYPLATVPFGSTCAPAVQTRTCDDGSWSPDYPACANLACAVAPPAGCGATAHGGVEVRACYAAASVPAGQTCGATQQSRTCFDGAWAPDWPACAFLACTVAGAASCGSTPSGSSETRPCYASASVPSGSSCASTEQVRTCADGSWSPDYPACAHLACTVTPEAMDLRVPEDKANVVLLQFEPWHGPGFDNDQRGLGARPPGQGSTSIQPLGAEPGVDPDNPEDPFPSLLIQKTYAYRLCDGGGCRDRSNDFAFYTTGYDSSNPGVVARQRRQIKALGADAVLVDLTNGTQRYPSSPPGNALWNMMTQSVPALYAGLSGADRSDLKVVPLFGVLEDADVSDAGHGFGKILDDWHALATATYPGRSLLYEGKPLVVVFHAVNTHGATCHGATRPCWQLAYDYLRSHRPSGVSDPAKSWLDFVTVRHMGGLYDSQPSCRDPVHPGTPAARVKGVAAGPATFWTWTDRFAPAAGLAPSFAATPEQYLEGEVEAFTVAGAVGGASWQAPCDAAGTCTPSIDGSTPADGLDYCYETRRGALSCAWGRPGRYAPDATLRREAGVWSFQRYLTVAKALRPTFLLVHQWNQFEQTDEGFDFQTTNSLEPANWGPDPLAGNSPVDPWAPYHMARGELASYRTSLAAGRIANVSLRAGVTAEHPAVAGIVLPAGSWQMQALGKGPALAPFISGYLPDPALELFDGAGGALAANDNCGPLSLDACLQWSPSGGAFTVVMTAHDGASGVGILELNSLSSSGLVNVSGRAYAEPSWAEATPILGFVVADGSRRVFLTGRGPSLGPLGLSPTVGQPSFALYSGATPIATSLRYDAAAATATGVDAVRTRVGAFPLSTGDAVLIVTLPAGQYTLNLSGASSGHAMLEVYDATR